MPRPTPENVSEAFTQLSGSLAQIEGVISAAFYGFSPIVSNAEEPDLDLVVVIDEEHENRGQLTKLMQEVSNRTQIILDVWIVSAQELFERTRRFTNKRELPAPVESPNNWIDFAFIAVKATEALAEIIRKANGSPVNEQPIPPDDQSKILIRPQN